MKGTRARYSLVFAIKHLKLYLSFSYAQGEPRSPYRLFLVYLLNSNERWGGLEIQICAR